jgi:hypothetical protein
LRNAEERGWTVEIGQLDDRHIVRRMILKRCVYGVDKNPMAVEFDNHETVCHSANKYVRLGGFIHTNTAECRFSLMKRAVFGTHHSISEAHLSRYLAEWDFKFNARKISDGERAAIALKGIEGKRLTYRIPNQASKLSGNKLSGFWLGGGCVLLLLLSFLSKRFMRLRRRIQEVTNYFLKLRVFRRIGFAVHGRCIQ